MTTIAESRLWTAAEDLLLLDLVRDHSVSNNPRASNLELSWRHVACCMNELSTSRAIIKLRLYEAAEVEVRYRELRVVMDLAREAKRKARDEEGDGQDREMVRKGQQSDRENPGGKPKDSWGGKEVVSLD